MNKTRRMLVAGLGAMTPAFVATDHVQARTVEPAAIAPVRSGAPALALDQEALKSALLELSPAEKLRIAGDRIRLAKSNVQSTRKGARYVVSAAGGICGPTLVTCPTHDRFCWLRPPQTPRPQRAR